MTTGTWMGIVGPVISVALNLVQFLGNRRLKQEFSALKHACGVYLKIANDSREPRSQLHAQAEGTINALFAALGHLAK